MTLIGPAWPFGSLKGVADPSHWTQDQGVDISAPAHTLLRAIGGGTIVGEGISGFGSTAPIIRLDDDYAKAFGHRYVYYGHTGAVRVRVGDRVKAGQVIGEVGAGRVGISTGPHLEIGLSDTAGPAARGATSGDMLTVLKTAWGGRKAGDVAAHGGADALTGGAAAAQPQLNMEAKIAQGVVNTLWNAAGHDAMRVLLYLLLVGGGLALALAGTRQLTRNQSTQGAPA